MLNDSWKAKLQTHFSKNGAIFPIGEGYSWEE
jgi:hypothetical protein